MKLNVVKTIEENIIKVDITVDELGTNSIDASEEKEQLHDFPKKIAYKDIEFKANMKLDDNGDPIVTVESPDASTIAEVELELINKEFVVDENLNISLSIDVNKIPKSDLGAPFDSVEKLGKARAQLFIVKVQAEIAKKLAEIRALYSESFEGETEVIL